MDPKDIRDTEDILDFLDLKDTRDMVDHVGHQGHLDLVDNLGRVDHLDYLGCKSQLYPLTNSLNYLNHMSVIIEGQFNPLRFIVFLDFLGLPATPALQDLEGPLVTLVMWVIVVPKDPREILVN